MDKFTEWFTDKMERIGYTPTYTVANADNLIWMSFGGKFEVVYVKQAITLDVMRGFFESQTNPILFIVDSDLVTDLTVNNAWLRAIHALYYGRIYVWDGVGVSPVHHDKQFDTLSDGGYIDVSVLSFEKVDCWYPGFPGVFNIARFDDPTFWKTGDNPKYAKTQKPPKDNAQSEYEAFWKEQYAKGGAGTGSYARDQGHNNPNYSQKRKDTEDVFRDFKEAFERNKRTYEANNPPPPPSRPQYHDKWLNMLMAEGTLAGAKKKYRQLALENHPDRKGDSPEVIQTMQLINAAYARVKEILI